MSFPRPFMRYTPSSMNWITLEYSKSQVDAAGRTLADPSATGEQVNAALNTLNNRRAGHSCPLNPIEVGLRQKARAAYEHALIAQRLKRVPSIIEKLRRFPTMQLSRMQDIAGCRAIVETVSHVRRIRVAYARSQQQHQFVSDKDYIDNPKESGYRGIHLIYRYQSERKTDYNGRLVEIQLRTRLQHAWATAVETMSTFLSQSLKSSEGSEKWLRFFTLTSSAFALLEHTAPVPGTPRDVRTLREGIGALASELQVREKLGTYGEALKIAEDTKMESAYYFLLSLMPQGYLAVYGYEREQLEEATAQYLAVEKSLAAIPGAQAVLVAVDSLIALKRSYANYYLDTQIFVASLSRILERPSG